MNALKALHHIHRNIEPIGYDYNCRFGACGRCTIMFDGVVRLACWAPLSGQHTIEPLKGYPVIKDLVVDTSAVHAQFVRADTVIKTLEPIVNLKDIDGPHYWKTLFRLNACKECMACYSVCTALQVNNRWESFIGPGALAQIYFRSVDTTDKADRVSQAAFSGAFECVQCGNCTKVCTAHIPIMEHIHELTQKAEARGLKPANTTASTWPLA